MMMFGKKNDFTADFLQPKLNLICMPSLVRERGLRYLDALMTAKIQLVPDHKTTMRQPIRNQSVRYRSLKFALDQRVYNPKPQQYIIHKNEGLIQVSSRSVHYPLSDTTH